MEQKAKITMDHERIRRWAERRGGRPATVARTAKRGQPGILRIDFPGYSGEGSLKPISWDEWFQKFGESRLAFLYQDKTKDGKPSRFFKLVKGRAATRTKTPKRPRTTRKSTRSASRSRTGRSQKQGTRRARSRSVKRQMA
jgi:hypothetical protein